MSEEVKQFWEQQAESYTGNYADVRRGTNHNFRTRLALVCRLARGCHGRLLDCATGSGEITEAVLCSGGFEEADLVDISEPMLQLSRARLDVPGGSVRLKWIHSSIFDFLVSSDPQPRYGLVLCLGLVAHTGRLDELLRLCGERLVPGGRILLQTSLLDHPGTRFLRWFSAERHRRSKGYAISYYSDEEITNAVDRSGLTLIEKRRFAVGVPYGDRLCAPLNYLLEKHGESWAARHGMDAIYSIGRT